MSQGASLAYALLKVLRSGTVVMVVRLDLAAKLK
jgi:hypothetical protein